MTGRALPLAAQGGNGSGGAGSENGNGGSPASVKATMEKQLDNPAEEALAQTAAGGPSLEGRRIGNPPYEIGNPPYGSCCRPNPEVGSMACHAEITPVGHANGKAGCPATQPIMNK